MTPTMKIKTLAVLLLILLISLALPVSGALQEHGTNEDITIQIKGRFGVTVTITNTGTEPLININWSFTINNSLFGMANLIAGTEETGTIQGLATGEHQELHLKPIGFGIVKTSILVEIGSVQYASSSDMALIFIFLIGLPDCIPD